MDHPPWIVQRFRINRQPRMPRRPEDPQQITKPRINRHGNNIGARHHDVVNPLRPQPQHVLQHFPLARREIIRRARFRQRLFDITPDRSRLA